MEHNDTGGKGVSVMLQIFFSHGTGDRNIAELYKDQIEQMNMHVYLFEHDQ